MKRLLVRLLVLASGAALAAQLGCSSSPSGGEASGGKSTSGGAGGASGASGKPGGGGTAGNANGSGGAAAASGTTAVGGMGTGGSGSGGAPGGGGGQVGGAGAPSNAGAPTVGGATGSGGVTGFAGSGVGGMAAGNAGMSGTAGACTGGDCAATTVVTYPTLPGATKSPLYTVKANGTTQFDEKMTKFAPEMQDHYAHCSLTGSATATISETVSESFTSYTVSPKSRNIAATKSGNTITFDSGPNYFIVQFDTKELLFILVDADEVNPPHLGDANVKSIADYNVDATGATLVTSKIQAAIDAATGATQNILYFPPGKYLTGELWLKSNMTLYLAGGAVLYGSSATGDFNTGSGGVDIEDCTHGMIRMYMIQNAKILGRGVIDGNGLAIRGQNDTKINLLKIEESSNILIDGVIVRDPSFWNTLVYRSDMVTIKLQDDQLPPHDHDLQQHRRRRFRRIDQWHVEQRVPLHGGRQHGHEERDARRHHQYQQHPAREDRLLLELGVLQDRHEDDGPNHRRGHVQRHRRGEGGPRPQRRRLRHRRGSKCQIRKRQDRGRRHEHDRPE